ncbi:outer membrane protein assembly factor BamE [Saccharibacter floricola]|uniref:outer membrane protein assembly factor BamE n=1 Tax=Saccharibacter floricola TaxID=231053 RepID=UPI00037B101D|nr:outer membrane protein assembly factor BamE [Saccharibacter floricola]
MTSAFSVLRPQRRLHVLRHLRRAGLSRRSWAGILAGSALLLSGCAPPIPRGALIDKEDYSQLTPNTSTQSDALSTLGSPTTHATFNDNTWIYVSMTKDLVPLSHPAVDKQQVLVLNFDNRGVLRKMSILGRRDAIPVRMVNDKTPTPGTQISVIQELLGNVGRYNPMSSMGSTFGGGMGGGGMGGPMSGQGTGQGGVGNTMQ